MSRTPELGRRARGLVWYTAMLHLGRAGIAAAVARACSHARLFAELLADVPGVTVLNRVELNQVLIRIEKADASSVAAQMRSNGVAFLTTSRSRGQDVIRISVSGYRTSEDDVRRTVQAIAEACRR
jgi:glutamate/tyrosine decarboxylase-like PLP-dependent enzyme